MQPISLKQWGMLIAANVAVSALTSMAVVRTLSPAQQVSLSLGVLARPTVSAPPTPVPSVARPAPVSAPAVVAAAPTAASKVRIVAVNAVGQRQREQIVIANEGDLVDLKGWSLSAGRDLTYTFQNVALLKDSFVNVFSTAGSDTSINLFMGRDDPAWQTGDLLVLRDPDGQKVDAFQIR